MDKCLNFDATLDKCQKCKKDGCDCPFSDWIDSHPELVDLELIQEFTSNVANAAAEKAKAIDRLAKIQASNPEAFKKLAEDLKAAANIIGDIDNEKHELSDIAASLSRAFYVAEMGNSVLRRWVNKYSRWF